MSGPDFLGNMPKNKVANKFRDAILQMEEKRHTDGSNGGSNAFLSKRNPNRPHVNKLNVVRVLRLYRTCI